MESQFTFYNHQLYAKMIRFWPSAYSSAYPTEHWYWDQQRGDKKNHSGEHTFRRQFAKLESDDAFSPHFVQFAQPVTMPQRALVSVVTLQYQLLKRKRTRKGLNNYTEEKFFKYKSCTNDDIEPWPVVSNHWLRESRGSQSGSLTAPTRANSLAKFFILLLCYGLSTSVLSTRDRVLRFGSQTSQSEMDNTKRDRLQPKPSKRFRQHQT